METLLLSLMGMVSLSFALKLTFATRWQLLTTMLLLTLFVGLSWPWAIEQSRTQIAAWMADQALVRDLSVWLTIDVCFVLTYCWISINPPSSASSAQYVLWLGLVYYPSTLIFPVLFSALVISIFALPGFSFAVISWGLALLLFGLLSLAVWGLRWLLPEQELRLELLFLLNILILLLGIIATMQGQDTVPAVSHVDAYALLGVLVLALGIALMGYLRWKYLHRKKSQS